MYKKMYELIRQASWIYIYRHVSSDYDALGAQYGLAQMIQDTFPQIRVVCLGEPNSELFKRMDIEDQRAVFEKQPQSLAIVLDTANRERIDGEGYDLCSQMIKVDHHVIVDRYASLNIEDPDASSTCELLCRFYMANADRMMLSQRSATLLFYGIVGDTNRFMYESATAKTFAAAKMLLESGIEQAQIYESMYLSSLQELKIKRFILDHFVYDDGIAYYVMGEKDLNDLGISRDLGSMYVNTLANISEIHVWLAITYQKESDQYRVSLRSRKVAVQPIATRFNGGGHRLASGAKLDSLDQLPELLSMLKEAIKREVSV